MIWTLKNSLRVGASLGLLLAALPGVSLVTRSVNTNQQQAPAVQPQSTETQKTVPAKPVAEPSMNDAPVAPPAPLPDAPVTKPAPAGESQQVALPEQNNPPSQRGTAAAEAEKSTGVAASRPSGMAIAPAKQHRRRSFLVKVGAVVGLGVAGGTVFALSRSSPGKAPGIR